MNIFNQISKESIKCENVNKYYTPSIPITNPEYLKGRDVEVKSILDNLTVPGRHCMIYGDRGIGKSSLANAAIKGALQHNIISGEHFKVKCDTNTKFKDIVSECALFVFENSDKYKQEKILKTSLSTKFLNFFSGSIGYEEKITIEKEEITPRKAAQIIGIIRGIIVLDEFDILDESAKKAVAEFIKHLSDNNSNLKVLLVGISTDGKSLTAGHESVNRCLHEISLGAVDNQHLIEIINVGENGLNITFDEKVKTEIVDISNGFPYFTHLLCKGAAESALLSENKNIDLELFYKSIEKSVDNAEGRLKRDYEDAIRSFRTKDVYKNILLSASKFKNNEFSVQDWINQIEKDTGIRYKNQSMSNYIGRLIKTEYGAIIKRLSRGVYKISDPRMPSFIRMANVSV